MTMTETVSMSRNPIFCMTHPRACSTAFERVFMTRDDLFCLHEPFGDAFYYGPERMGARYEHSEQQRVDSGFSRTQYSTVFERLDGPELTNKRAFIKDMAYYLLPPDARTPRIAPSLLYERQYPDRTCVSSHQDGGKLAISVDQVAGESCPFPYDTEPEPGNPTVIPNRLLKGFQYTFLIRDPHYSIPSYYRCTVPPLNYVTGWDGFLPSEAGYDELRRMFDYLVQAGLVSPSIANQAAQVTTGNRDICVIDADDLLDYPAEAIEAYCFAVDLPYDPCMLRWGDSDSQQQAIRVFDKWRGWHDDAINSTELRPRSHKKASKTEAQFDAEWVQKYGLEGANTIRRLVDANMDTYRYLKQFALQIEPKSYGYLPEDDSI